MRFILGLLLCVPFWGISQVKIESETRIAPKKVPKYTIELLKPIPFKGKPKWYKEISQEGLSYECKAELFGTAHSIEFDSLGHFQDIEKTLNETLIPGPCFEAMQTSLNSSFQDYQIEKIQQQFTGPEDALLKYLKTGEVNERLICKWELVVTGSGPSGAATRYEILFDEMGLELKRLRFPAENFDNLDY